ncbi:MAG: hypothetical protein JNM28_05240 [Armatimonadetes bacterium]|nr:hypothetical protein [Armatimonadota bacterium]MBS1712419.1 hypothetical protein [Armatimonadota bacterium]MBX3109272.1 hypothetical protein [Fimbriimonadaceae bacterium]
MSALGMIAYLVGALIVGGAATIVMSIFRSVKKHDEFRSWRWMALFALIAAVGPYVYAEVRTQMNGEGMADAAAAVFKSAKVNGKVSYYKVMQSDDKVAKIIVVGKEKTSINDNESIVIQATLKRDPKKGWKADTFEIVDSFDRGKDGVTFPPYW